MSTSFPHGFHGFQGLTPTSLTTNSTNRRANRTEADNSITYRPGGHSPIEMAPTVVDSRDNDIECHDDQPITCAVAVHASSDCGGSNHGHDVPISIAVPIYGHGLISGM